MNAISLGRSAGSVYVIHEPSRYDHRRRAMVAIDISPAAEHGPLKIIFPGLDRPPYIDLCAGELKLAMESFRAEDRLLMAGDMELLVFAAVIAARKTNGDLTLLKWDRESFRYFEVRAPRGLLS